MLGNSTRKNCIKTIMMMMIGTVWTLGKTFVREKISPNSMHIKLPEMVWPSAWGINRVWRNEIELFSLKKTWMLLCSSCRDHQCFCFIYCTWQIFPQLHASSIIIASLVLILLSHFQGFRLLEVSFVKLFRSFETHSWTPALSLKKASRDSANRKITPSLTWT